MLFLLVNICLARCCSCHNLIGLMIVLLLFVDFVVVDVVSFVIGVVNKDTSVIMIGVAC